MKHKRKTSRRRKAQHMSAAAPRRRSRAGKTARRRTRKKSGLSEIFSHSTAMAAARSLGSAAVGGVLATSVNKLTAAQPPYQRIVTGIAASFVTYAIAGFPYMAAGMAGAFTSIEIQPLMSKLLSEDSYFDYANPNALNEMPVYLNENGEAVYLNEAGEAVYLNEAGEVTLAEEVYLAEDMSIYPSYSTQY